MSKYQVFIGQKRTLITRKAILDAAVKAFSKYNFQDVSIRDIAEIAKVHHATIRYHFGSKENLWSEVLKVIFENLRNMSSQLDFTSHENPRHVLTEHIVRIIKNIIQNPGILRIYHTQPLDSIRENNILKPYIKLLYRVIIEEVKLIQANGFGSNIPTEELYFIYTSAINVRFLQTEIHKLITGKSSSDDAIIRRHAEAIVILFETK